MGALGIVGRLAAAAALAAGCPTEPAARTTADAEVYVAAYCQEIGQKLDDCESPIVVDADWMELCFEDQLGELDDEPCHLQSIEFGRCRAERLSCSEYNSDITTLPGTVCYEAVSDLLACGEEHGLPMPEELLGVFERSPRAAVEGK